MGGPSAQTQATQNALTQQQINIAQQQNQQQQVNYQRMQTLQQPEIGFLQGLVGGDNAATMTAAAPMIGNISASYQSAKDQIFNNVPAGAGRDFALAQLEQNKQTSIGQTLNQNVLSAYDKLTNIGAGLGSFSLQELGASLSGFSGASSSNQALGKMQAESSPWNFIGSLVGAAGTAFSGTKLWGG